MIDVEATGGNGIDTRVPSFSLLNAVAGSTGDTVRFREHGWSMPPLMTA
ncbi:hypothetical protein [Geobacter anodireducens]